MTAQGSDQAGLDVARQSREICRTATGRLKRRDTDELTLERRPLAVSPGERGTAPAPLALPSYSPDADPGEFVGPL